MCGIFGFAGKPGNHEFNILKFATLGAINDARGGDSAGAFIDGACEYGIGDEKLFSSFAVKNQFLRSFEGVSVQHALGHCRKASVGAKTIKEAQPICVPNDEGDKIDLVMVHNGTLLNHDELKDKYLSKVPDYFTDSQIFANVVYYHGFKVLEEYNGAGAFVFVDYRKKVPTTYIFRGESKLYTSSVNTASERPLFWAKTPEGIWFSSIKEVLELILFGVYPVEEVPGNTLIIIQNGKVVSTKKYDRSARHQLGYSKTYTSYRSSKDYEYEDYYGYRGTGYYSSIQKEARKENSWNVTGEKKLFAATKFEMNESDERYDYTHSNKVIFKPDGRYYRGKVLLNGAYKISEYGFENTYSSLGTTVVVKPKTFYFFDGFLMKDALCMYIARTVYERAGEKFTPEMIRKLTMTCFYNPETKRFYTRKGKPFTGNYPIYFTLTNRVYKIKSGEIISYEEVYDPNSSNVWKTYTPQYDGANIAEKFESVINKSATKILNSFNIQ